MLAHEQAADHYARALEVLERFDPDGARPPLRAAAGLGEAQVRSGERPRAWPAFREAAALAARARRRRGAGPGGDRRLAALRAAARRGRRGADRAARAGAGDDRRRATRRRGCCCCRGCAARCTTPTERDRMRALSAEATVIAAELDDPRASAWPRPRAGGPTGDPAISSGGWPTRPSCCAPRREAGDIELTLQGHAWLVVDLLEHGDRGGRGGPDRGVHRRRARAAPAAVPVERGGVAGDERAAGRPPGARPSGSPPRRWRRASAPEGDTAPQYYAIQLLAIRREQARMAELEAAARDLVRPNPQRPAWRAALATLLCETGRIDEARPSSTRSRPRGFADIPRDGDWMVAMTLLGGRRDRAGRRRARAAPLRAAAPVSRGERRHRAGGGVPGRDRALPRPAGARPWATARTRSAHLRACDRAPTQRCRRAGAAGPHPAGLRAGAGPGASARSSCVARPSADRRGARSAGRGARAGLLAALSRSR